MNLFDTIPGPLPDELTAILVQADQVRIERITSQGHASPKDFWYDQDWHEWVVLLTGSATLQFSDRMIDMKPGDHILIAAHERHRVERTDLATQTIWLAVFFR